MDNAVFYTIWSAVFVIAMAIAVGHLLTAVEYVRDSTNRRAGIYLISTAIVFAIAALTYLKLTNTLNFYFAVVALGAVNVAYSVAGYAIRLVFSGFGHRLAVIWKKPRSRPYLVALMAVILLTALYGTCFHTPPERPSAAFYAVCHVQMPKTVRVVSYQVSGNYFSGYTDWIHFRVSSTDFIALTKSAGLSLDPTSINPNNLDNSLTQSKPTWWCKPGQFKCVACYAHDSISDPDVLYVYVNKQYDDIYAWHFNSD